MNSKTTEQTHEGGAQAGAGGTLGQQLRRAREARGVGLREIAEQTRITMRHLEAIEADDYKHLPGGIFNRSFIKAYARYVGFDENRALDLYARDLRERGDPAEDAPALPQRARVYTGDTTRSPLATALISLGVLGLFVLVGYAGLHYYRRTEGGGGAPAQPSPAAEQAAAEAAPPAPTPDAAQDFQVRVRAKGRAFWLTSWEGDGKKRGRFVTPDRPEEFRPDESLNLFFDRASMDALEVTVNGQPLRPPAGGEGREITWTITKDNYRQFSP